VLGPIRIGTGATIAAGAHVSKDVPEGALVAGNLARVVKWGYDNSAILGSVPEDPPGARGSGQTGEEPTLVSLVMWLIWSA
jgi:hypothetical protein